MIKNLSDKELAQKRQSSINTILEIRKDLFNRSNADAHDYKNLTKEYEEITSILNEIINRLKKIIVDKSKELEDLKND